MYRFRHIDNSQNQNAATNVQREAESRLEFAKSGLKISTLHQDHDDLANNEEIYVRNKEKIVDREDKSPSPKMTNSGPTEQQIVWTKKAEILDVRQYEYLVFVEGDILRSDTVMVQL